ncbi:MAG TPA: HD domain-containing protein [Nitrososphaeria archaeon]|nr:MAG: hypothetical protein DRN68_01870 [Nitrososphaerota archaeon]HDJ67040.1 HD domain-containing protein [Nitrososphaeria archaeon]
MDLIIRLHEYISRLKELRRTGWVQRGVKDPETVASHSYAVALLTLITAELKGLDALDAVRMALIHDLAESIIGDLTPEMKAGLKDLEERERKFFEDLLKLMPRALAETYLDAWRRFSKGEDEVSRLVREVDKLERGLQAIKYLKKGYAEVREIYESALNELKDPELKKVLGEALEKI